jgi:Flp pilus assembly protein TadD
MMDVFAQAVQAYQAREYARAASLCQQLLRTDPFQSNVLSLLAFSHLALNQLDQAVGACRQALQVSPNHVDAHNVLGIALARQKKWAEAEASFRRLVEIAPQQADGYNNLGVTLTEQGKFQAAEQCYRSTLRLNPRSAEAFNNLGNALKGQGKLADAEASFRSAIALSPNYADAHHNIGLVLKEQGRLTDAEAAYRRAIQLNPENSHVYNNLGNLLNTLARFDDAERCYHEALRLNPNDPEAHSNLGVMVTGLGRLDEAARHYHEALRVGPNHVPAHYNFATHLLLRAEKARSPGKREWHLKALEHLTKALAAIERMGRFVPESPQVYNNLGTVLRELGRHGEAETAFRQSLVLKPGRAEVLTNLGQVLRAQGRLDEAEQCFVQAVQADPAFAGAHNNLGLICMERRALTDARAHWEEAVRLKPELANAWVNLAVLALLQGDFTRGWELYEWRWRADDEISVHQSFDQPVWDGTPLNGRTIFLHFEQGLGDTIQFVRFAPLVQERGGTVVLELPHALAPLLQGCAGVDRIVPVGTELPRFDTHAPLMSLPRILGTTLETIPATIPYVTAEPTRVAAWRDQLDRLPGLKVGIVWQGNPLLGNDRIRSVPLARFAPLAHVDGVQLIALQKNAGREQLPAFAAEHAIIDWGGRLDETTGSMVDAAAVLMGVDLFISIDTALAHLAGALGRPVWVALAFAADWRWQLDRDDSPWYPTMRLFRQTQPGDWEGVFVRIAQQLAEVVARPGLLGRAPRRAYDGSSPEAP